MSHVSPHLPMRRIKNVFFVGIGGAGMSGIAEVMLNLGYKIFGSDLHAGKMTRHLESIGATIFIGHAEENVCDMDVVVVSSAINESNPEVKAAAAKRIPLVRRAEMLAELMRFRYGIAIAGTHGKTTTTSLVAAVMGEADLDPTFIVGGKVNSIGSNSKLGAGQYLVAEADESDASFLHLQPMIAVVTNIDVDHMPTYGNDFEKLQETFLEFLHHLPFYGLAVVCVDDPTTASMIEHIARPCVTYGFSESADVRADSLEYDAQCTRFTLYTKSSPEGVQVSLNLLGKHNVQNALASVAIAEELGIPLEKTLTALRGFQGIGRRMHFSGDIQTSSGLIHLMDDYAHHPREIAATVDAVRNGWLEHRLVAVFQPHRYSRTHDLFDDFAIALEAVDVLVLLEVYSAGEEPIANADSRALARAIRSRGKVEPVFVEDEAQLIPTLLRLIHEDDVVITLGAGSIGLMAAQLPQALNVPVRECL